MLDLFDFVMWEKAPAWRKLEYEVGLIGFPFNAILDWPMATASGYAFFLKAEVNEALKAILDTWSKDGLMTDKSLYVITTADDGWLSQESREYIEADTNVVGSPLPFVELFECDPQKDPVHWGFKSWDDFIRKFRNFDQIHPVAFADKPEWVVNSCESKAFALQTDVQEFDTFWLKGQPYSVVEIMDHHELAPSLLGGGSIDGDCEDDDSLLGLSVAPGAVVGAAEASGVLTSPDRTGSSTSLSTCHQPPGVDEGHGGVETAAL